MGYEPIPAEQEMIGREIVDAALKVHKAMGPGLLESVYEECMSYELRKRGLQVEEQVCVPIEYDGAELTRNKLRMDMLVGNEVVVENKAVLEMNPIFEAQILTYLRLSRKRLGFLINYNVPLMKSGIKRFVV